MTSIQLIACIGMVTGFFILLRLSPMEFTDGVFPPSDQPAQKPQG